MAINYSKFQKKQKAVAVGYDPKVDYAPKVLAIGKGVNASMILEIAKEHNIPIHEDADLVKILDLLEINSYVPLEVYSTLAEILSYIYKQDKIMGKK